MTVPIPPTPPQNAPLLPSHLHGLYKHVEVTTASQKGLVLHYEFDAQNEAALKLALEALAAQRGNNEPIKCDFGSYMDKGKKCARVEFTPEAATVGGRIVRNDKPSNIINFAMALRNGGALPLDDDHLRNLAKDIRRCAGESSAFRF